MGKPVLLLLLLLLSMLDFRFDVIGITETKLMKNKLPTIKITMEGYNSYDTPTESEHGGVIMYVNKRLTSIPRKDLNLLLYKPGELESIFVEIVNKKCKNIILGTIYRHPSMDLDEFNRNFLGLFMEKVSKNYSYWEILMQTY